MSCIAPDPLSRLRLLMVTPRYPPDMGGVETHTREVARRLAEMGVHVTVLATDRGGNYPDHTRDGAVRVWRVPAYPRHRDWYYAPAVARVIAAGTWDLVHCQGFHTLVPPLAMHAARRAGIPYVVTSHTGGHSSRLRGSVRGTQWRVLRPLLAGASRLVTVSRFEAETFARLLRLPPERFVTIPNGASLPPPSSPPPAPGASGDAPLIVSSGRLERYKGHGRILAALPRIRAQFPGAHLLILGGGPEEAHLRRQAARLGVAAHVEIRAIPAQDREAMADTLARADLVTLLSDYEAHPLAVMEALSLGRPALVADTSGLREIAQRGWARAVPPHSTAARVAAAAIAQLRDPLVPTGVALPTWDDCVRSLCAVYRDALATDTRGERPCAS